MPGQSKRTSIRSLRVGEVWHLIDRIARLRGMSTNAVAVQALEEYAERWQLEHGELPPDDSSD